MTFVVKICYFLQGVFDDFMSRVARTFILDGFDDRYYLTSSISPLCNNFVDHRSDEKRAYTGNNCNKDVDKETGHNLFWWVIVKAKMFVIDLIKMFAMTFSSQSNCFARFKKNHYL